MADIDIKRGYEILPDNSIKFGIRVTNNTVTTISEVETILDYSEELFKLEGVKIKRLGQLPPKSERTAIFILKPLTCIHNEKITATVLYKDSKWELNVEKMKSKCVDCVCPFLKEKQLSRKHFIEKNSHGKSLKQYLYFKGISTSHLISLLNDVCANRLYKIEEFEFNDGIMVYYSAESISDNVDYLLTVFVKNIDDLCVVYFKAASNKEHGLSGFLSEISSELNQVVSTVKSAQEISFVKKENIINIKDSVIQRTNFNNNQDVSNLCIEDSVIQNTHFSSTKPSNSIDNEYTSPFESIESENSGTNSEYFSEKKRANNFDNKKTFFSIFFLLVIILSMVPLFETTYEVKKPIYTTETYISTEPQEKIETYIEQEPYEVLEQDSRTIVDEKRTVRPGYYLYFKRYIDSDSKVKNTITGKIVETAGYDINFFVFDETNFKNWASGSSSSRYVSATRVSSHNFQFTPKQSGNYYFVLDNRYSWFTNKVPEITVEWKYEHILTKYRDVERERTIIEYVDVEKEREVTKYVAVQDKKKANLIELLVAHDW